MTTTKLRLVDGEVQILTELLSQLLDLYDEADESDPAIDRLSPAAYRENDEASAEFRRLTHTDLMVQRSADATAMLRTLDATQTSAVEPASSPTLALDDADALAWMRTLAALRLVMATRLDIDQNDDHDPDDPAYALYDWLGYRLETVVDARDD